MARRKRQFLVLAVIVAGAGLLVWSTARHAPRETAGSATRTQSTASLSRRDEAASLLEKQAVAAPSRRERTDGPYSGSPASVGLDALGKSQGVKQLIADTLVRLQALQPEDTGLNILRDLIGRVLASPPSEAAQAIASFLETHEDVATGLPFAVGPDGALSAWPTLRTALLDVLPAVDPLAALELGAEIMDTTASADEFALALRNMAWNDVDGDLHVEMMQRFQQMLEVGEWRATPTTGFLEAFDIPVAVGGSGSAAAVVTVLAESARQGGAYSAELARAAFVALDRIAVRDSATIARMYLNDTAFLDEAPNYRASIMSRLDVSGPEQRSAFLDYIARTDHADGELEYFAELYPNANFFVGYRLVTSDETMPTIAQRQDIDRRILKEIQTLAASAPNERVRTVLERIQQRLGEFTQELLEPPDAYKETMRPATLGPSDAADASPTREADDLLPPHPPLLGPMD